jgi:hypothetical protein
MPQFGWISDESFVERVLLRGLNRRMKVLFNQISALECGWPLILFLNGNPNGLKTSDDYAFLIDMDSPTAESNLYAMIDFGLVRQADLAEVALSTTTIKSSRLSKLKTIDKSSEPVYSIAIVSNG